MKIQRLKGEVLTLKESSNLDSHKVTNKNTGRPCQNIAQVSPLMDRT